MLLILVIKLRAATERTYLRQTYVSSVYFGAPTLRNITASFFDSQVVLLQREIFNLTQTALLSFLLQITFNFIGQPLYCLD